jgi:hypothetical protein
MSGTMLYDLDPVPEDNNTRKPEVEDYVDYQKQAAKLGHPNPATRVCLPHLLNRYFISPDMVIISVKSNSEIDITKAFPFSSFPYSSSLTSSTFSPASASQYL